jgi:hypothetical protein
MEGLRGAQAGGGEVSAANRQEPGSPFADDLPPHPRKRDGDPGLRQQGATPNAGRWVPGARLFESDGFALDGAGGTELSAQAPPGSCARPASSFRICSPAVATPPFTSIQTMPDMSEGSSIGPL